jgi:hypothetical protein
VVSDATATQITGLTLLTIVASKLSSVASGSSTSYTAGLVSQTAGTNSGQSDLDALLKAAERMLGISYPVILQMMDNCIAGGSVDTGIPDQSRLLVDII